MEKFREVYSALYSSASTAGEVETVKLSLDELIKQQASIQEINKITEIEC